MTRVEIESRIAEINTEEREIAERQYRYGYMVDINYFEKLFYEKMKLIQKLNELDVKKK